MVLLTDLSLDLHVHICEFLHPSQIITLRQTCKGFHEAASRRIVWIHALNRICRENQLFSPTFPIADMSVAELERAATAPMRWMALSSSEHTKNDTLLPCRTERVIKNPVKLIVDAVQLDDTWSNKDVIDLFLVPGGRYLVASGPHCVGLWDLAYVPASDVSVDQGSMKMWAITVHGMEDFFVHPTPDGLGLRILTYSPALDNALYVFEIYPQSQDPKLEKIAELTLNLEEQDDDDDLTYSLNGNRVVIYDRQTGKVMVWDFVANTVASWSISSPCFMDQIIKVTETAIILLHTSSPVSSMWIFEIPPLTTKTPLFDIEEDLPEIPPDLTFPCPYPGSAWWQKPDGWYKSDLSSLPLYLDVHENPKSGDFGRSKLDIASDFSTICLTPIATTIQCLTDDRERYSSKTYRICDDGFVNALTTSTDYVEAHTSSTFSGSAVGNFGLSSDCKPPTLRRVNTTRLARTAMDSSFCPASSTLVFADEKDIVVKKFW